MSVVIKAENISKNYIISHRQWQRYGMLRDVLVQKGSNISKRLLHPLRASSEEPMVELSGSEIFWALKDINFNVEEGEVVGIVGRNGAGKSTLLKILSRITEPTTGFIAIKGKVNSLLEVGTGFHPELTGRENIFLNGAILGMSLAQIRSRFDEIVSFAEVSQFLDTPMKRYSSGMQVRLAFSIATHLESDVLIVDEVLAVGDTSFQKKCLGKMHEFSSKEGRSILFVSHSMSTVQDFCTRCLLLQKGEIVSEGDPKMVVGDYLETYSNLHDNEVDCLATLEDHEFIRRLRISSKLPGTLTPREALGIEIDFDKLDDCPAPELELSIENADGLKIIVLRKELSDCREFFIEHRQARSTIKIDELPLRPGRYWISGAFFPGPGETAKTLDRVLAFNVADPSDLAAHIGSGKKSGLITVREDWLPPTLCD